MARDRTQKILEEVLADARNRTARLFGAQFLGPGEHTIGPYRVQVHQRGPDGLLGGDFVLHRAGAGEWLLIGDVAGNGRTAFDATLAIAVLWPALVSPYVSLRELNERYCEAIAGSERAGFSALCLSLKAHGQTLFSGSLAGAPEGEGGERLLLRLNGLQLGLKRDVWHYRHGAMELRHGGTLQIVTDGAAQRALHEDATAVVITYAGASRTEEEVP
jgi:hypothetical protein